MSDYNELHKGLTTAFIDGSVLSDTNIRPQFVYNNPRQGKKVLVALEEELSKCDSFDMSVAFITMSGITPLLQCFADLAFRNIKGRILTTDFLLFSDPKALRKLNDFPNIEVKMYQVDEQHDGFHTKGYMFKQGDIMKIIVGSSNMTMDALSSNREWNHKIVSTSQGEVASEITAEFEELWASSKDLDLVIDRYEIEYRKAKVIENQRLQAIKDLSLDSYDLQPNSMQQVFIRNVLELREQGAKRAMLISSTGTGKTYASAFALREMDAKKVLFVVHREQIARQALTSYKRVFGSSRSYGLLSGTKKEIGADFIFSTMQTIAKNPEIFAKDHFDIIVLDECHHAGADSYNKILDYYEPEFVLGMTASPDTNNYDIYEIFDHKIAYEIRLQQALEDNLLCPFHYFGITEFTETLNEKVDLTNLENFRYLVADQRVDYMVDKAEYYGYSGDRVKGLVFVSRKDEARILSDKFNQRGYRTCVLTGEDNQTVREIAVNRLTGEDGDDALDYIFTVDVFNEGVDLPEVNQILMVRPTQSSVVFIQQLGRGLRKFDGKEYVVIIDFIGNYNNNFMIPVALSGDRTYNKDNYRRYIQEGARIIPGASTVHFDEISKKRIYESLDSANFTLVKLIRENYTALKNKLGRIPELMDFERYGEMDVCLIFDNNSLGSYYNFLSKYEDDYKVKLSVHEAHIVEFVSKKLANGMRIHELALLRTLMYNPSTKLKSFMKDLSVEEGLVINDAVIKNVVNVLTNDFPTGTGKKTYEDCVFLQKDGDDYKISDDYAELLKNNDFYDVMKELLEFGIHRYRTNYGNKRYQDTNFVLYQKYTYEDISRLLNWEHNIVPLIVGGYKYDEPTKTFPVYINYDKAEDVVATQQYEDHFINNSQLIALSKSNRTVESDDVQNFLHAKERGIDVHLFVRKNKDDKQSKEFYYLGRMTATGRVNEVTVGDKENGGEKPAVEIEWILDTPVREDIYQYIIG